jgi:hypothetical protein
LLVTSASGLHNTSDWGQKDGFQNRLKSHSHLPQAMHTRCA